MTNIERRMAKDKELKSIYVPEFLLTIIKQLSFFQLFFNLPNIL